MRLLVVGTLAFDSVQTPSGTRNEILGGSAAYLATCASYFSPVQLVSIVGTDFPDEHLRFFESRRICTQGVAQVPGRTFRWRGVYDQNLNDRRTLETQLNVLTQFRPVLPRDYCDTEFVVLGNIDPELQLHVLQQLARPQIVACDTMNYWIESYRPALENTLHRVGLLLINDSEARQLAGEHNLMKAAQAIRSLGPSTLVIKRGEHGAMLFDDHGIFVTPAFPLAEVRDPTGAGDSFAGGMMGYLAKLANDHPASRRQAMVLGTVMASFVVEDFSIDGVRHLTPPTISERLRRYRELIAVNLDDMTSWAQTG